MTSATHRPPDILQLAVALVLVGTIGSGAMAEIDRSDASIDTPRDASNYVMAVLSGAGCRMRFAAFQRQVASDGLADPTGAADDPATLVAAAPLRLLNEGLISEDPGDPQILVSSGPGCD